MESSHIIKSEDAATVPKPSAHVEVKKEEAKVHVPLQTRPPSGQLDQESQGPPLKRRRKRPPTKFADVGVSYEEEKMMSVAMANSVLETNAIASKKIPS